MRKYHTPGKSKQRDQDRADMRSKILTYMREDNFGCVSIYDLAHDLDIGTQKAVSALTQLVKQGEIVRVKRGEYADPDYVKVAG